MAKKTTSRQEPLEIQLWKAADEEDDFDFKERFTMLKAELEAQMEEEKQLNDQIMINLNKLVMPENGK